MQSGLTYWIRDLTFKRNDRSFKSTKAGEGARLLPRACLATLDNCVWRLCRAFSVTASVILRARDSHPGVGSEWSALKRLLPVLRIMVAVPNAIVGPIQSLNASRRHINLSGFRERLLTATSYPCTHIMECMSTQPASGAVQHPSWQDHDTRTHTHAAPPEPDWNGMAGEVIP